MIKYRLKIINDFTVIEYTDNNNQVWWLPEDPANTDYQAYLAWVAEGNEAEEWSAE